MSVPKAARGWSAVLAAAWIVSAPMMARADTAADLEAVADLDWRLAQEAEVESAVTVASGGVLDSYSRFMFSFNKGLYDRFDRVGAWFMGPEYATARPDPAAGRISNVVANLVNEPLTAVTSVAIGEFGNALRSVQRFGINSTVGVLGYYDTAAQWGYTPMHTDVGLSLCRAGVGEYGYVVLPFVGPRTGRDAVADVMLMNLILWTFAGLAASTGASIQTIVIAESVEVVADITATRYFDIEAKNIRLDSYEETRDAYLAQRRARCARLAEP